MTYRPSSIIRIGSSLLIFGEEVSKYKTPCIRTRGANEAHNQQRGEPDWIDTVATLMLWRELVLAGIPVTYLLTANGGDETDLRVQVKGDPYFIDINVKGTKASVPTGTEPEALSFIKNKGHTEVEFAAITPTVEDCFIRLLKTRDERNSHKNN